MAQDEFQQFRKMCLEAIHASYTNGPNVFMLETALNHPETEEEGCRDSRVRALMAFYYSQLIEGAEEAIDSELQHMAGEVAPNPPNYTFREDSQYYEYNVARSAGYSDFTEDQRRVVKGVVMMTAFKAMTNIASRLEAMSENEIEVRLRPIAAPDLEHPLHKPDLAGRSYWNDDLPRKLTKYEY